MIRFANLSLKRSNSCVLRTNLVQRRFNSQWGRNTGIGGPSLLYSIIGANLVVFGAWHISESDFQLKRFMEKHFLISSDGIVRMGRYHTAVTSFFSHKDPWHLAFNMLALYTFGLNTMAVIGTSRFMMLYFGGGLVSSLAYTSWPYIIPRSWPAYWGANMKYTTALGASGAVYAVVAWHILTFPRNMLMLYGVVPLPAPLLGAAMIGYDMYQMYTGMTTVGSSAHLGGAAYGMMFYGLTRRATSYRRF
jgi:membrane associated rhomboid family serine protease